jgi:hypothetical protein
MPQTKEFPKVYPFAVCKETGSDEVGRGYKFKLACRESRHQSEVCDSVAYNHRRSFYCVPKHGSFIA